MKKMLRKTSQKCTKGIIYLLIGALTGSLSLESMAQSLASAEIVPQPNEALREIRQTKSLSSIIKEVEAKYNIYVNYEGATVEGKLLAESQVEKLLSRRARKMAVWKNH
jgi:hypothetical protein